MSPPMVSPLASGMDYRGHERYQEKKAGSHRCIPEDNRYGIFVVRAVHPAVEKPTGTMPVSRNRLIGENPQDSKEGDGSEAGGAEAVQIQANPNGKDKAGHQ
jgi:hypothetical protein